MTSSSKQRVTDIPSAPIRAVLPTLWIYLVTSYGISKLTTALTSAISKPLAARSVASK